MSKNHVVACAIVKNEPRFGETLASLREVMGDALADIAVHDTGTDRSDAADVLVSEVKRGYIKLQRRPFDNFSSARNACLDNAQQVARSVGALWLFMFSAGAEFSGRWAPSDTDAEALQHTERLGDFSYAKICTIHACSMLRFRGLTHEVIDAGVPADKLPHCGLTVDYSSDYDPEKKRARWELDAKLLAHDYSPRGRFYLGRTFKCLGRNAEAFACFMQRLDQVGHVSEWRQAAVDAIETAPTLRLARFAAEHVSGCADVHLALAEREWREKNHAETRRALGLALGAPNRSMFRNTRLLQRCAELGAEIAREGEK